LNANGDHHSAGGLIDLPSIAVIGGQSGEQIILD
jgi:hypothetical protein